MAIIKEAVNLHAYFQRNPSMADLSKFNPNAPGNPNNNIFGLPFTEEDSRLVLLPVPWEVTASFGAGTARSADHIYRASKQVEIFDSYVPDGWRQGFFMREIDKKLLMKSDYLRKEAELYIDYISKGSFVEDNKFMLKSLKEINEGSELMNNWVYENSKSLLVQNKLVGLVGGDHSTPFGFYKALAEVQGSFGILQIDAHCDLRKAYEGFKWSHASIMYNTLEQLPEVERLVQVGTRDLCEEEWNYICNSSYRVVTYFDELIKQKLYEGQHWNHIADTIVNHLPQKVHISFDIDGLDPKLCPSTGTPVLGGLQTEEAMYLVRRVIETGRTIIGFDLVEIGIGENGWDSNVGARILWKLCNYFIKSHI
ncbi:agmatinase family protein [soil metagenome]